MAQVIFRIKPLSRDGVRGASGHIRRDWSEPHVDQNRTKLNRVLIGSGDPEKDYEDFLRASGVQKVQGKTVAAEIFCSASPEYFKDISPENLERWIKENERALRKKFGKGLVSLTLHLDEQTPHLHAVYVPVDTYEIATGRGGKGRKNVTRISYTREFNDTVPVLVAARRSGDTDTTKMGRLQTWYAEEMSIFGLDRGRRNSRVKHKTVQRFQSEIAEIEKPLPKLKIDWPELPATAKRLTIDTGLYTEKDLKRYALALAKETYAQASEIGKKAQVRAAAAPILAEENKYLKVELRDKTAQIDAQRAELAALKKDKSMTDELKRKVDALMRGLPAGEVLARLGYVYDMLREAYLTEAGLVRIDRMGRIQMQDRQDRQPRNVIDLLVYMRDISATEAMGLLREKIGEDLAAGIAAEATRKAKAPSVLPPPVEGKWLAVRRYLTETRKLPGKLVDDLYKQKRVYADDKKAAVFVLGNGEGCELRGTVPLANGEPFKGNRGEKALFILHSLVTPKAAVYVESAIDALSYRALYGEDFMIVSTCGQNKTRMIEHAREMHKKGIVIVSGHDRDSKGESYLNDLRAEGIPAISHRPRHKDWNEELKECSNYISGFDKNDEPIYENKPAPVPELKPYDFPKKTAPAARTESPKAGGGKSKSTPVPTFTSETPTY